MLLRKKNSTVSPTTDKKTAAPPPVSTAKWTNGSALGAKSVSVLVLVALVCGPLALGAAMLGSSRPAQSAPARVETGLSVVQQSAGSYALGYVGAWLGATQEDSDALRDYFSSASITLSSTPFEYRNMAVTSITTSEETDLVTVVVAADVRDAQLTDDLAGATWPRRYFQVAVSTAEEQLTAVTLPAPIAGPTTGQSAPALDYLTTVATSDAAGISVVSFLTAYLTGQGSVEPYTSPQSEIRAITPAPYLALTPVSIMAAEAPLEQPADGVSVPVLATVAVENAVSQKVTATYALVLSARDNRWEISSLDPAPQLAPVSDSSVTPTPVPTGAGTQEGK